MFQAKASAEVVKVLSDSGGHRISSGLLYRRIKRTPVFRAKKKDGGFWQHESFKYEREDDALR